MSDATGGSQYYAALNNLSIVAKTPLSNRQGDFFTFTNQDCYYYLPVKG